MGVETKYSCYLTKCIDSSDKITAQNKKNSATKVK